MSGKLKSVTPPAQYVELSRWNFGIWWSIILAAHLVTGGYNAAFALFYTELKHTYLYVLLEYSRIGMFAKDHPVIVMVNTVMAILHGLCVLQMVGGSLWRGELAFSWTKDNKIVDSNNELDSTDPADGLRVIGDDTQPKFRLTQLYSNVFGRHGLVGVNGSNFHTILIGREFVETSLQTVQAYRMSWLLPRMLLNRFFLSLIVMNCWSSVLVYSLLFRRSEARKRLAYLICDCTLNIVSCIGVPLIVVLSYIDEYDFKLTGFAVENWYNDEWSARVLNEFQMLLVVSWMDLASRTIFSLGVITTANSMKDLMRRSSRSSSTRIACDVEDGNTHDQDHTAAKILAHGPPKTANWQTRAKHRIMQVVYGIFALWGFIIIGFHAQASVQPALPQCVLQVRPWAVSNPACYLAVLDCHRFGISGKMKEVEDKWDEFDRSTVVTLVIRHCPELEVPDSIGDFHITTGIKLYNTTIADWGESAAITNTNHPEMIWFYLIRVNVTDGLLPAGTLSSDFPQKLYDLEFTYTNIRELPDNVDSKWLFKTALYLEYSELTRIPPSLIRLEPYSLSLVGSPIVELPPEIFEVAGMALFMAGIHIQEFPRDVKNISLEIVSFNFEGTNVSFFWSWIDPLVENHVELLMGGSPYCNDLKQILSGEAETFSVMPSPEYSTILMDASEANREVLSGAVNCDTEYAATVYPIDYEDSISAVG